MSGLPTPGFRYAAVVVASAPEHASLPTTTTRRIAEAGRLLGIPLLDHLVVGDRDYASLATYCGTP